MGAEVRFHNYEDKRREEAVRRFKFEVRRAGITTDYDMDIEYMDEALLAFADEWRVSGPKSDTDHCAKHGTYVGDGSWCGECINARLASEKTPERESG